jgi:2-keto-4-pentenoate hydratase
MERDEVVTTAASDRPAMPAILHQHWRPLDPTLGICAAAYDELRARWQAQRPLRGWKIGAHHAAGRAMLGVQTSLLGFLPVTTQYPEGALIDLAGTQRPGVEAEIAVHMRRSVAADDSESAIADAIAGLTISAEIVDIGGDHTDPCHVLRRNMFHRGFMLPGAPAPRPVGEYDAVVVGIELNGREQAAVLPLAVLGDIRWIVGFVAASLACMGEEVAAGHVILTGAVTQLPIWVIPGDAIAIDAGSLGRLNLNFKPTE